MFNILMVVGVIAALIYYVLKMRANARPNDEDSENSDGQGFMNDMFISSNDRASTRAEKNEERSKKRDDEHGKGTPLLGDPYGDLEKLAALHEKGILTLDEYTTKKKEILKRI